jgi:hypothetical protein
MLQFQLYCRLSKFQFEYDLNWKTFAQNTAQKFTHFTEMTSGFVLNKHHSGFQNNKLVSFNL